MAQGLGFSKEELDELQAKLKQEDEMATRVSRAIAPTKVSTDVLEGLLSTFDKAALMGEQMVLEIQRQGGVEIPVGKIGEAVSYVTDSLSITFELGGVKARVTKHNYNNLKEQLALLKQGIIPEEKKENK